MSPQSILSLLKNVMPEFQKLELAMIKKASCQHH